MEFCISSLRAYGRDCVAHLAVDNKWGTAASGTASPLQPSQGIIHLAKLKVKKRPFCKYASYLTGQWDLLIAYCYFKSGLAAIVHLSLEYSVWKKAGNFILK